MATPADKMALAAAALEAGNYASALSYALAAHALAVGKPDIRAGNELEAKWDRPAIAEFIKLVRQQQAAAAGIQQTRVTYARPTAADDYS